MKPYRTTPPPRDKALLLAWACAESLAWPATTAQGSSYTWWVRYAQNQPRGPSLTLAFATPIRVAPSDWRGTMFEGLL